MILLVEDSEDDVFFMERAMRKTHLSLPMHVAHNGREALDYLQAVGKYSDRVTFPIPSLIFLDLKLPLVHGFEVLDWIKKQPSLKSLPVAILTSSPEDRDREKASALGASAYLVKPPTAEVLLKTLHSLAGIDADSDSAIN